MSETTIAGGVVMTVRDQIDYELQNIKLPENFERKILHNVKPKKTKWKYQIAVLILCFILGGTTVYAGYVILNKININREMLPDLQPMKKKETKKLIADQDEIGDYRKEYDTYDALCEELGIKFLNSDLSKNNTLMMIQRKTDNENWEEIRISPYILGDISKIEKVEGENFYSWERGKEYAAPVDLLIEIISSEKQLKSGWEKDYLETFAFVESYQSKQGYLVNILQDTTIEEKDRNMGYKSKCYAIFVADGIRYTLSGSIELEKMKELVDSMHY